MKKIKIRPYSPAWFAQRLGAAAVALAVICLMGLADTPGTMAAEEIGQAEEELFISDVIVEPEPQRLYDIPLDADLQTYIIDICNYAGIDPKIVFGVIQAESRYNPDAVGDNGDSLGLMQIQPRWHRIRMDKLGCQDLLDPWQNVIVGVDILAEKLDKYQDVEKALMAYNAGDSGAYEMYFSRGIYSNGYSQAVLKATGGIHGR